MMEMVLQQSAAAIDGGGMVVPAGVPACRPGPRPAATAPMMAKQARDTADEEQAGPEEEELRRGPWTVDEDLSLINYIADHGEGRWNALARAAGLKRTGKSCRLRWLNYLRPDVKRGDFTADEQLLILDLHSRWGNRWSKIAAQLPGRTDNEIKNYWRTRVQKHAKQLNCDVNSSRFKDAMRFLWMPRLAEQRAAQRRHQHQPPALAAVGSVAAAPSSSPLMTTTDTVSGSSCYPPSSAVDTTAATPSSCSSLTSSVDTALTTAAAADDDYWGAGAATTTVHQQQQQQNDHHYDIWSALPHLTAAGDHHQFQQQGVADDLTGWVQGFSDDCGILSGSSAAADTLWSLDDIIWRMP